MEETTNKRKKRTQRDYNLGFKLAVVAQVEKGEMTYRQAQAAYGIQGRSTVLRWLRKHGSLNWTIPSQNSMSQPKAKETPAQRIKRLEKELEDERLKNAILSKMIDIADQQYGTALRKKYFAKQLNTSAEQDESA
jgi:transposase